MQQCSLLLRKKEETTYDFSQNCVNCCLICIKMETQKIAKLLNDSDNESSKFATRKWYIINDQNNGQYGNGDENGSTIKFETKVIKPNLCDYSYAYILVTGDITAIGGNANTKVVFKNCAPFTTCITHINDEHVETAENLDIIMSMYNLLEYSDNYADSSGSLYQFKKDEQNINADENRANVTTRNSSSFEYTRKLLGSPNATGVLRNAKVVVPLKYLSKIFRSLEMPLINCKIHSELSWSKNCVISVITDTTFKITTTKLHVPIVTLSTKGNVNLAKKLNEGFKRSVYRNEYKSKIETQESDSSNLKRFPLEASFQVVNRLFVLAFDNTSYGPNKVERNSHKKYFLERVRITNYNVLVDSRNFYDQPNNDLMKQYDEIRKQCNKKKG